METSKSIAILFLSESLALRLLGENRSGRTWRKIAREDYRDKVSPGTLCRIANTSGRWIPKGRKLRRLLGLVPKKEKTSLQKQIDTMVEKTRKMIFGWKVKP